MQCLDNCQVIRDVLMNLGSDVEICRDGKQAVEYFCSSPEKFDLVILDMIMPKVSGKEALEQMKRSRSDVKVLVSSGYSTENGLQGIFDAGASGFIQKSFDIAVPAKKVAGILGTA